MIYGRKRKTVKAIFVLPNLNAGGAERVVTLLSRELVALGLAVDIALMLDEEVQYEVPNGVQLVKLNTRAMPRKKRLNVMRKYFSQEKKRNPQLVVLPFHDSCLKNVLMAVFGLNIRVVASERNNPYIKGSSGISRLKANVPYALASACVFQTPDARAYYAPVIQKKGFIIANPLQLNESLVWSGEEEKSIVSVGRLEPQKNHSMLIEAFEMLHREYPEYILDVYGEGSLRAELQAKIQEKGLQNAVYLRGYSKEVQRRVSEAALFVLSSDYEGMSNALIEALAIGVPSVSTDHPIGGARWLIQDGVNGLLTPVADAQALYLAMKHLLENSDVAKQMSEEGKKLREKLSACNIAREWLQMIKTMRGMQ